MPAASIRNSLRRLTAADIPSALALSSLAGWNQTEADWSRLLHLEDSACLAVECDSLVVATATLIFYHDQLGWLGMVLTHPNYRHQGLARHLVGHALEIAEARQIRTLKLDATEFGIALYRSFGFQEEESIERWSGPGRLAGGAKAAALPSTHFHLDRQAFGVDRSEVLRSLSETAFVASDGFAFCRPGAHATYLGPCVARSADSARDVIENCLSTVGGPRWFWDLLSANGNAVQIARDLDFKLARKLVRMRKGPDLQADRSMIYAGSGFELG
jgi:ribosomal protein S18 acetylase RimI-like enzyme